jgi:hypothetical protein
MREDVKKIATEVTRADPGGRISCVFGCLGVADYPANPALPGFPNTSCFQLRRLYVSPGLNFPMIESGFPLRSREARAATALPQRAASLAARCTRLHPVAPGCSDFEGPPGLELLRAGDVPRSGGWRFGVLRTRERPLCSALHQVALSCTRLQ